MFKLAVFVEGLTEQVFLERLVREIAGQKGIEVVHHRMHGGDRAIHTISSLEAKSPVGTEYLVLIVNCSSDNTVASDIRDNYDSLAAKGYSAIIGIRDVFPKFSHSDIPKLRAGLRFKIKTNPIPVNFVLGVMEVEAWFIAEHTHFTKIDSALTNPSIQATVGFDPSTVDSTTLANPAKDLHDIYKIVNLAYRKHQNQIQRTVNALDYAKMYVDLRGITDFGVLIQEIDKFLG